MTIHKFRKLVSHLEYLNVYPIHFFELDTAGFAIVLPSESILNITHPTRLTDDEETTYIKSHYPELFL